MFSGGLIFDLLSGNVLLFVVKLVALVIAFVVHEWGHAYAAVRMGDQTPRYDGRLTLNPVKHIDPVGMLLIALVGFGWAKPVITNPARYKHKWGDLLVSSAGVLMNFLVALICLILQRVLGADTLPGNILAIIAGMNVMLAVFNLLPIPPLDGSHILLNLLPRNMQFQWRQAMYNPNASMLLIVALLINYYVLNNPLASLINGVYMGMQNLVGV